VKVELSICIATYNRAAFIGRTLESIIRQLEDGVEILVVDGASPDNTCEVVDGYVRECPRVRYVRLPEKGGVDQDYDRAVTMAHGRYCWFFTDDDILKPGAVKAVLAAIARNYAVVVLNTECRTLDLSGLLIERRMAATRDRDYGDDPTDREQFFRDVASNLSFIGALVIERDLWLSRERAPYYGSAFAHVGALFGSPFPGRTFVLAEPWVTIRLGNSEWVGRRCEIWLISWPTLIWSFGQFSDASKAVVCRRHPWKRLRTLLLYRAIGAYSFEKYLRLLHPILGRRSEGLLPALAAVMPVSLARILVDSYCSLRRDHVTPYMLHPDRPIKKYS
jgi:abequosyltransferase